jgi:hypothetical protein
VKTIFILSLGLLGATCLYAEKPPTIPPHLVKSINHEIDTISSWVTLPVFVEAVKAQNLENLSMDTILHRDSLWIRIVESKAAPSDLMTSLQNNRAGQWLKNLRKKSQGKYRECFVCDSKGALVAASNITSDYFQGDESKWIDCFNSGNGKPVFGDPEYDNSSDALLIQVSVPVKEAGKTIGVFVAGIKFNTIR